MLISAPNLFFVLLTPLCSHSFDFREKKAIFRCTINDHHLILSMLKTNICFKTFQIWLAEALSDLSRITPPSLTSSPLSPAMSEVRSPYNVDSSSPSPVWHRLALSCPPPPLQDGWRASIRTRRRERAVRCLIRLGQWRGERLRRSRRAAEAASGGWREGQLRIYRVGMESPSPRLKPPIIDSPQTPYPRLPSPCPLLSPPPFGSLASLPSLSNRNAGRGGRRGTGAGPGTRALAAGDKGQLRAYQFSMAPVASPHLKPPRLVAGPLVWANIEQLERRGRRRDGGRGEGAKRGGREDGGRGALHADLLHG